VTSPLDYEVSARYTLAVMASDNPATGRRLTTYASVVVDVTDDNDIAPVIVINTLSVDCTRVSVSENVHADSLIAYVSVTDRDSAFNAVVSCRLDDQSAIKFQLVQLGHNEFNVISSAFDREQQDMYHVVITCQVCFVMDNNHSGIKGFDHNFALHTLCSEKKHPLTFSFISP